MSEAPAVAFTCVSPLVLIGALIALNGRRHASDDIARVEV